MTHSFDPSHMLKNPVSGSRICTYCTLWQQEDLIRAPKDLFNTSGIGGTKNDDLGQNLQLTVYKMFYANIKYLEINCISQ